MISSKASFASKRKLLHLLSPSIFSSASSLPKNNPITTTTIKTTTPSLTVSSHSLSTTTTTPIVELRQYHLHPSQTAHYTQQTTLSSPLRTSHLPLALFAYPETGSLPLNTAFHLYHYPGGLSERSTLRTQLANETEWKEYLKNVKGCMMEQRSGIFVEAKIGLDDVKGLKYYVDNPLKDGGAASSTKSIIELRKYQLQLGYDTVPKFLSIYSQALPYKLRAPNTHPTTELVTVLVNDVGSLNTVYEVWKHGGFGVDDADGEALMHCGMEAMEQSRQASRGIREWREGIAEIAKLAISFESSVLKPSEFSPLK